MRRFTGAAMVCAVVAACSPPPQTTNDSSMNDVARDAPIADSAAPDVPSAEDVASDRTQDDAALDVSEDAPSALDSGVPEDAAVEDAAPDAPPADVPSCPPGQLFCGACVDTRTNPTHCGGCGVACLSGQNCVSGRCECPAGQTLCAGRCVNTMANASHCGACGNACTAPQLCESGRCALPCASPEVACGAGAAMVCTNTATDSMNCGACGTACPAGRACVAGSCACAGGRALCGGTCVDTQSDGMNCGACGTVCASGASCVAGACACPGGQTACGGTCVDTASSAAHCGGCGRACGAGQVCVGGTCASSCAAPRMMCSGSCVDVQSSNSHCGSCNSTCGGNNTCVSGRCAPTNGTLATAIVVPSSPGGISYRSPRYELALPGVDVGGCVNGAVFYRFTLSRRSLVHALVQEAWVGETAVTIVPDTGGAAIGCGTADTRCGPRTSEVTTILNPGVYYVAVGRRAPAVGQVNFELILTAVPAASGQNIAYTSIGAEVRGRTPSSGSTVVGACRPSTDTAGEDAYYFTSCASDNDFSLQAETLGSWFDSVLHVAQTDALAGACNDNGFASRIDARVLAPLPPRGGLNVVYVDGARATGGAYRMTIDFAPACTAAGWQACGGRCIAPYDLLADPNNCGACGNRCASGTCNAGSCVNLGPTQQLVGTVAASNSTTLGAVPPSVFSCQFDEALVGFRGSLSADGTRLTSLQTLCQQLNPDATTVDRLRLREPVTQSSAMAGTAGAQPFSFACPEHHVVTGVRARVTGTTFGELRFDCSPLATSRTSPIVVSAILPRLTVAAIGSGTGSLLASLCPAGTISTGFVAAGTSQIDGLALRCATPRVSTPMRQTITTTSVAAPGGGVGVEQTTDCLPGMVVDGLELYSLPPSTTFTGVRARCRVMSGLYSDAGDFVIAQRGLAGAGALVGTIPIGARTDVLACPLDQALVAATARGSMAGINGLGGVCQFARIPHANGPGRTTAGGSSNFVGVASGSTSAALCPANSVAVGITARINGGALTGLAYRCAPHSGS